MATRQEQTIEEKLNWIECASGFRLIWIKINTKVSFLKIKMSKQKTEKMNLNNLVLPIEQTDRQTDRLEKEMQQWHIIKRGTVEQPRVLVDLASN